MLENVISSETSNYLILSFCVEFPAINFLIIFPVTIGACWVLSVFPFFLGFHCSPNFGEFYFKSDFYFYFSAGFDFSAENFVLDTYV